MLQIRFFLRIFLTSSCILLSQNSNAQLSLSWGNPITVVSDDLQFGNMRPRVAASDNGEVVVIWGKDHLGEGELYVSRLVNGAFTTPEIFNLNTDTYEITSENSPNIVAWGDDFYIAYKQRPGSTGHIYTRKSTDGGQTWAAEAWVTQWLNGQYAIAPHVAVDGDGHPHVAVIRTNNGSTQVGALCSVDNGISYTSFILADAGAVGVPVSWPFLVIDGHNHVVVWRTYDSNSGEYYIYAVLSTNNGATFGNPVQLNDQAEYGIGDWVTDPEAVINGDSLMVTWSSTENMGKIRMAQVAISNFTVATPSVLVNPVAASTAIATEPTIANLNGQQLIVWLEFEASQIDLRSNWRSGSSELAGNQFTNISHQNEVQPSVASGNGKFHLVYVDTNTGAIMYQTASTSSTTGNQTLELAKGGMRIRNYLTEHFLEFELTKHQSDIKWQIHDIQGRSISNGTVDSGLNKIDCSVYQAGQYFVTFSNNGKIIESAPFLIVR